MVLMSWLHSVKTPSLSWAAGPPFLLSVSIILRMRFFCHLPIGGVIEKRVTSPYNGISTHREKHLLRAADATRIQTQRSIQSRRVFERHTKRYSGNQVLSACYCSMVFVR